jgi:hypothetical protein
MVLPARGAHKRNWRRRNITSTSANKSSSSLQNLVAPLKDSNPQPLLPLGSAPAPRAPRVLSPLSAPCPSRLLHPARCAQGLFLEVEVWQLDVALLQAAVLRA